MEGDGLFLEFSIEKGPDIHQQDDYEKNDSVRCRLLV
jgi:hypothetical protein